MKRRHKCQVLLGGNPACLDTRFIKINTIFDKVGSKSAHGIVLFHAIAVGHIKRHGQIVFASRQGNRLPVVAPCRSDDPGNLIS